MELAHYLPEIISVSIIAMIMAVSPGADFVMVTRNSIFYGRRAGLYSALGISLATWIHATYSIAGLAIIISTSIFWFSILKYCGAAYLIYIGWKTLKSTSNLDIEKRNLSADLSHFSAFKIGFITNALNPKTSIFFLSIFTQVIDSQTSLWMQLFYAAIISSAHLMWFSSVAFFLSQKAVLNRFYAHKRSLEKVVGAVLIGFGFKVATTSTS